MASRRPRRMVQRHQWKSAEAAWQSTFLHAAYNTAANCSIDYDLGIPVVY